MGQSGQNLNMAFPAPPEDVLTTPRFAFRNSMIPRPVTNKEDDGLSPKSVIVDRRFVSPASSSSSSIDRRTLSETNLHKGQPRHDRGYSISDGEFSDSESFVDYSGTSRELGKVCPRLACVTVILLIMVVQQRAIYVDEDVVCTVSSFLVLCFEGFQTLRNMLLDIASPLMGIVHIKNLTYLLGRLETRGH